MATTDKTKRRPTVIPPVIPEIAKAYQNDPRTLVARAAMDAGTSTAPVAQGQYAYADGAARALQAIAGAYTDRKVQERYAPEEARLVAEAKARADKARADEAALAARQQPQTAPAIPLPAPQAAAPPAPPPAAAVASALGDPPPTLPQGAEAAQGRAIPFGLERVSLKDSVARLAASGARITSGYRTPEHNAKVGGVADSYHTRGSAENPQAYDLVPRQGETMAQLAARTRRELGSGYDVIDEGDHVHVEPSSRAPVDDGGDGTGLAGGPTSAGMREIPNAPAPVARPNAPEAVAATKSRLLQAAYDIMLDENPFSYAQGQDMYQRGLTEQTSMDESAAERQQRIRDMGYQTDLNTYATAQQQDRAAVYDERRDAQSQNFQAGESQKQRDFTAGESRLDRQQRTWETKFGADLSRSLQATSQEFQAGESQKQREHDLALKKGDTAARAQEFFSTAAGNKFLTTSQDAANQAGSVIEILNEFETRLKASKRTGGAVLGNAPGLVKWSNSELQILEGLTNELALGKASAMKGSLSDKDVKFLVDQMPNIRRTKTANLATIARMRAIMQRAQDYQVSRVRAVEQGEGSKFMEDWAAYTGAVDTKLGNAPDFQTWRSSRPAFDKDGNPVRK